MSAEGNVDLTGVENPDGELVRIFGVGNSIAIADGTREHR
jgi:hypothetical protein